MPGELHQIHSTLGEHNAQLEGHRRELDGLWVNDKARSEQITRVRIEMAKWLGGAAVFIAIVNAIAAKFTIEAITKALGGH